MKKYLLWVCSISMLIFAIFWYASMSKDDLLKNDQQAIVDKKNQLTMSEDQQIENVQICAQADTTPCSTNSDCNSGNCYAGICEPCEPTGMACSNDGNCCKATNCSNGFCGGDDEWVPVYAMGVVLGSAAGIGAMGVVGRIGFNYKAYATQQEDLDTAQLEQDMDDIINSQRVEGLEADMEYAEENPEVVQVTAEDDEEYLEENSSEVSYDFDESEYEIESEIDDYESEIEEYEPEIEADLEIAGEDFVELESNPEVDEEEAEIALDLADDSAE